MNSCVLGIFSNNLEGLTGSVYLMLSHGQISSGLFILIGVLYDRHHTRTIVNYRGVCQTMPIFSVVFLYFSLANIAFPGTASFVAEMLTFFGALQSNPLVTFIASFSMVLAPCYTLWFYHHMCFGSFSAFIPQSYGDITLKEFNSQAPLIILSQLFGFYTSPVQTLIHTSCQNFLF